MLFEVFPR